MRACPASASDPGVPAAARPRPCRSTRSPRPPRILAEARRPIILAGGGALWSGAADAIEALARRLGAPVITTLNAKGLIDERSPLSLGHARSVRRAAALPHADVMLAVGCRFTEVFTDWRRMTVPEPPGADRPRSRADRHELPGRRRDRRPTRTPRAARCSTAFRHRDARTHRLGTAPGTRPAPRGTRSPNG